MILRESTIRMAAKEARKDVSFRKSISFSFDHTCQYDLFISHSFLDAEMIEGLYILFQKAGYKVYIDWIDDAGLDRSRVTKETARLIKSRLKNCKALAYISTKNTTLSKWCPWELGVADGLHNRVCILPIMNSTFKGQEYLSLYSYLDYCETSDRKRMEFWVCDPEEEDKYVVLRDWLKGKAPYKHR